LEIGDTAGLETRATPVLPVSGKPAQLVASDRGFGSRGICGTAAPGDRSKFGKQLPKCGEFCQADDATIWA
jgi:hypothetical protein